MASKPYSREEILQAADRARQEGAYEEAKEIEKMLPKDDQHYTPSQIRRASQNARQAGALNEAKEIDAMLDKSIGKGLGGPALSREQRENRISEYEREMGALLPNASARETADYERDRYAERRSRGAPLNPLAQNERVVKDPTGKVRALADPRINPDPERSDTLTAVEVGSKRAVQNYFQRKDDQVKLRDTIYENIFNRLSPAERERLAKPRHMGWQYDSYKNMPPMDFFAAVEKGGSLSREEIVNFAGGQEMFDELQTGDVGGGGLYRHVIQPLLTGKNGALPSEQMEASVKRAQEKYSIATQESLEKGWHAKDAELLKPTSWFDGTSKAPWEDWDGFYYSFMENAPHFAASIGAARGGGSLGAKLAMRRGSRLSLKADELMSARNKAATAGGMFAGAGTEALMVRDAVYNDTAQELRNLPDEKWGQNPDFLNLLDHGYSPEAAKQLISTEISNKAGTTAMMVSGALGAPMSGFFGRMAAGRLGGIPAAPAVGMGMVGEGLQEGVQESSEALISNINIRDVDPDRPVFKNVSESFLGGFFTGGPAGAAGALPSSEAKGVEPKLRSVIKATTDYTKAANERWAYQNEIAKREDDETLPPQQRYEQLHRLERLQQKEATLLLKAEPRLRKHMQENNLPEAELKMLDRLMMRANVTLGDIEIAKSKRMTASKMLEQERLIQKERAEIQKKVDENIFKRDDVSSLANAIEAVQNFEATSDAARERLVKEGYGRQTQGRFIILPKGARALKELRRQEESLQKKLDAGYVGSERRDPNRSARRAAIERAGPEQKEELIYTDHLTNMPNKRAFEEREKNAPAVAAVDVDSLKWVNDNMGHVAGDRLLQAVSDALTQQQGINAYRVGGDEFAVTGATEEQVEAVLKTVADQLTGMPIRFGQDEVTPAITWGKGKTYAVADKVANRMKHERTRAGRRAGREEKPTSYRVTSQGRLLFHNVPDAKAKRDSLKAMEPVSVGAKQWQDISHKEALGKAREVYRRHGETLLSDGKRVRLSNSGFRKARGHGFADHRMIRSFSALPELFEKAVPLTSNTNEDKSGGQPRAFHMYGSKAQIDLQHYYVKMVVREESDGEFSYYDHDLTPASEIGDTSKDPANTKLPTMSGWWKSVDSDTPTSTRYDPYRGVPTKWRDIRDRVERGDEVEILTPTGATWGTVTKVRKRKGKDRLHVHVMGRDYVFNAASNWLIRPEEDIDLEFLLGEPDMEPSRAPNIVDTVMIGTVARNDVIYADLGGEVGMPGYMQTSMFPNAYSEAYADARGWDWNVHYMPPLPREATDEQMKAAETTVRQLTQDHLNLPPITLVRSIAELKQIAPHMLEKMVAQGASQTGTRGFFDEENPENGVVLLVQNIVAFTFTPEKAARDIAETLLHEMIGHYGVRGVFGNEPEMRAFMHQIVDRFPVLAKRRAAGLQLNIANPNDKQLLGEEMIAYLAGEMLSKGEKTFTPPQKNLLQKVFAWIKSFLTRNGWGKYFGLNPDTNQILWEDADVQKLLMRAQDFVRNGKRFEFTYMTGQHVRLMRDGEIFVSGLMNAVNTGTRKPTKAERKQRQAKGEEVPALVPLFPEQGSPQAYMDIVRNIAKPDVAMISAKEMETSHIEDFLTKTTYSDIVKFTGSPLAANGKFNPDAFEAILPAGVSTKYHEARMLIADFLARPTVEDQTYTDEESQKIRDATEFMEITEAAPVDLSKARLTKDILLNYLKSDAVVNIIAMPALDRRPALGLQDVAARLYGEGGFNVDELTEDQKEEIDQESKRIRNLGPNIGYHEILQQWQDFKPPSSYDGNVPQGVAKELDYREYFLKQEGGGYRVGTTSHFGSQAGVLVHLRFGLAEAVDGVEGFPALPQAGNPEMQDKFLILAEMQTDWLQNLRKQWASESEKSAGLMRKNAAHKQLHAMNQQMGMQMAASLSKGFNDMIEPLVAVATYPGDLAELTSEVGDEYRKLIDERQAETGETYSAEQAKKLFLAEKGREVQEKLTDAVNKIAQYKTDRNDANQRVRSMDARAFAALDDMAVGYFGSAIERAITDLSTVVNNYFVRGGYATIEHAAQKLALAPGRSFNKMKEYLNYGREDTSSGYLRLPIVTHGIKAIMEPVYDAFGATGLDEDLKLERAEHLLHVPVSALVLKDGTDVTLGDPVALLSEMFSPSNLTDLGVDHERIAIAVEPGERVLKKDQDKKQPEQIVTVRATGDKQIVEVFADLVEGYLRNYIKSRLGQTYQQKVLDKEAAAAANQNTSDPDEASDDGVTWGEVVDVFDMEEHETDSNSDESRYWDVETFESFEYDNFDDDFSSEMDYELDNVDWDEVTDSQNNEPLNRQNAGYRERLEVADNGDVDNSDAEEWLDGEKEQHLEYVRQDENGWVADRVRESLRERWGEEGGTFLMVGRLPISWDGDGDVDDDAPIVVCKKSLNDNYELLIEGDEEWSGGDLDRPAMIHAIREYYSRRNYTPPPGTLFAPRETPAFSMMEPSAEQLNMLRETPPDFNVEADRIVASLTRSNNPKPDTPTKLFEDLVRLSKKRASIGIDSPLSDDKYWRTTALRFLLSDAVRRGIPGVVWNPGMATSARGGAQFRGVRTDTLRWQLEKMSVRGKEQELLVLHSPDLDHPMLVDPKRAVPILGRDVVEHIEAQRRGDKPKFSPRPQLNAEKGAEPHVASAADFLISTTQQGGQPRIVVQRRDNHDLVGIYHTQEQVDEAINANIAAWNEANEGLSEATNIGPEPDPIDPDDPYTDPGKILTVEGDELLDRGQVNGYDLGGKIAIVTGNDVDNYTHTLAPPTTAGARQSYEDITFRHWNKELKQYGVQIGEAVVKAKDAEHAATSEGARVVPGDPRADAIRKKYGSVTIEELTGGTHGWGIMSEKIGLLHHRVFQNREAAQERLEEMLNELFGQKGGLIKVFYIPITPEIIADYKDKPKAPFHFDPHKEPTLKSALDKIGQENQPSLRERAAEWRREWKDEFHQGMFDKFYGIKRALTLTGQKFSAEDDPYVQTRLTTSHESQMKAVLNYGHPVWKNGVMQVEGRGLLEILQPVAKDIDTWCLYMAGVRAKRLKAEGREKLFTDEEIEAMVALGDASPVLKRVAADYAAFNKKILDFAEAAGVINSDTRAMWENADYVPFYRVQDDRLVGPLSKSSGIGNLAKPIRRLKGGEANVGDIMQNIMINVSRLVDTSMKNHAAQMAVDALLPSGIIQKKPMTLSQEMIPLNQVKKLLIDRGLNPEAIPEDALEGFQRMFAIQPPEGPGVISILRNGKKEFYFTDDELLYRSMSMINMHQFGNWMNMLRAPKRLLTSLVTLDPGFMIANYMRDSLSAFVLSRDHFVPVIGAVEGFRQALLKDKDMKIMLSAGAAFESGYINAHDPNSTRRLIKTAMKNKGFTESLLTSPAKLYEAWRAIGSATENANRMAVYNAALHAGKSHAQAIYEAKDLMDFSMSGDWPFIQFLIQTVPFMGARMQGLHRLGRGFHEHPIAFTMKGTLVGLAGLALWFAFRDDERYKGLEDWDKRTYFHFWIGENHYRLPKPFEVGAIFNTIPELIFDTIYSKENDKGQHLLKQFGYMIAETFNMNPIPQAVRPLAESYFNYNWFTGRDIVSPYEEQRMSPEQYRTSTSPTMVQIARNLPGELDTASGKIRSPLHLQNLYHGYTGTLGRYFLMASDAMLREAMDMPDPPARKVGDYPVIGRFIRGDEPRRTVYEQKTYDLIRKVTQVQGSIRFLAKTGQIDLMDKITEEQMPYVQIAGALEDVRREVSEINNNIMQVYLDPKMTPDEKRAELDAAQEQKNQLFKMGYEMRPGASGRDPSPITQQNIEDLLNKFGIDEVVTAQIKDARPATANLLQSIDTLSEKNLESLAKASQ